MINITAKKQFRLTTINYRDITHVVADNKKIILKVQKEQQPSSDQLKWFSRTEYYKVESVKESEVELTNQQGNSKTFNIKFL